MPTRQYREAIASIESEGSGGYRAVGPVTRTGDRAYGKYQIMGANIGPWTERVLGKRMTPQEFLDKPEAQDAVFDAVFGDYVQRFGPSGAAQAWFAGPGSVGQSGSGARQDQLGTTVSDYVARFNRALGNPPAFAGMGNVRSSAPMPTPTNARERVANFIRQAPVANRLQEDRTAKAAGGTPVLDRMKERSEARQEGRKPILEEMQKRRQARGLQTPLIDSILSRLSSQPQQTAPAVTSPQVPSASQPPPVEPAGVSQPALTNIPMVDPFQVQSPFPPGDPRNALMGFDPTRNRFLT